ncbi:MAG: CRISPR-associated exonuclease Cas4/endonuclease Cas1 fusion [Planctomycetaceae bacterium]|nr:MAG: CRISPR-associated exonuclease Cas4/endonuclease Cas1 fusion [Planctomycetaceae bacterium]
MVAFSFSNTHAPPLRVMALKDLLFCKRLFYLQDVEGLHVSNEYVYAGLQLHAELEAQEDLEPLTLELESTRYGLIGKVDCLRRRDGVYIPYEHKRGRPARDEHNQPQPWPADRIQIIAYAVMLEEAFGQQILEGRIRYHSANLTLRVPIDQQARADLRTAIQEALQLRDSLDRPPVTQNSRICHGCSLAPVCLPEETWLPQDPEFQPPRLFPVDRDRATLHVLGQGAYVGVSGEQIVVEPRDGAKSVHALRTIDAVIIHGMNQISTQAIRKCAQYGIVIHWLTTSGHHTASLTPTSGPVQRRIRQFQALAAEPFCLALSKRLVEAKVEGQYRYILRASRANETTRQRVQRQLEGIQELLSKVPTAESRDSLRGLEGSAAVHYFSALRQLLTDSVPDELRFASRNRRPPLDRLNALLSYGYGLLHTAVMRGILASGLEPALGFFHAPRSSAYPLVLDLMELFRTIIWDIPLLGSLNRGQWDPDADFIVTPAKVWLSDAGKKKAITLFEQRLQETWKHPILNHSLTYVRIIELEARLLEKEWSGEPGLFAKCRLR